MMSLKVFLWDNEVGILTWDDRSKNSYFTFNPTFLSLGLEIAPLTAPIRGRRSMLPVYGEDKPIYQRLPAFIADSLPDSWGNEIFEQWRRQQHIPNAQSLSLEKLSFIGKRGMGALEFVPEIDRKHHLERIDLAALYRLSEKILFEREQAVINPDEEPTLRSLLIVGSSIPGRYAKAILAINCQTGEIRSGQIGGLDGFKYYIVKFNIPERSSAEIEMSYQQMAIDAGISMMPSYLKEIEGVRHFFTERFDRSVGTKLHVQTLAAMDPTAESYEDLIYVCRRLRLPEGDFIEAYRRMVFNVLANNTDDHNRNISFTMTPDGAWRLSPAYDMTFIFDSGGFAPNREHCLMIRGKRSGIAKDDLLQFAVDNGIRSAQQIIDEVVAAISTFQTRAKANGVADEWVSRIADAIHCNLASLDSTPQTPIDYVSDNGTRISNARIEMAHKGNYHLCANINGQDRRYVITRKNPDYQLIQSGGIYALTPADLRHLIEKYFPHTNP